PRGRGRRAGAISPDAASGRVTTRPRARNAPATAGVSFGEERPILGGEPGRGFGVASRPVRESDSLPTSVTRFDRLAASMDAIPPGDAGGGNAGPATAVRPT